MSKAPPALRFHGNKAAGFRHIRRGMVELFRTEMIQERSGVPIMKRTVEVSDYTTITVEIQGDQKIIHIYCNPPELPEIIEPIPEEEEPEVYRCPSAFLIRSDERGQSLAPGSTYERPSGYVVGYNYIKDQWRLMTIRTNGSILDTPVAGNVGWYHIDDPDGTHSKCDVVSWRGPSGPGPLCPMTGGSPAWQNPDVYRAISWFGGYVYFQGRRWVTPLNTMLGACVLKAPDANNVYHKYMYVHTASIYDTAVSWYKELAFERVYRAKLSHVLASGENDVNWELVKTLTHAELIAECPFPYTTVQGSQPIYAPRSTDYIDKDGFIYCLRTYSMQALPTHWARETTIFLKMNIRDLSYEILSTGYGSMPMGSFNVNNPGNAYVNTYGRLEFPGDSGSVSGSESFSNVDNPWIFFVYAGTQDLYYLALANEWSGSSSRSASFAEDDGTTFANSGFITGYTQVVVYKNHNPIKWIPIMRIEQVSTAVQFLAQYGGLDPVEISMNSTVYRYGAMLLDYHPEIPDSLTSITWETQYGVSEQGGSALYNFTLLQGDRTVQTHSITYPTKLASYGGYTHASTRLGLERLVDWADDGDYTPENYIGFCTYKQDVLNNFGASPGWNGVIQLELGAYQGFYLNTGMLYASGVPSFGARQYGSIGPWHILADTSTDCGAYGFSWDFFVPWTDGDPGGPPSTPKLAYAIHRPVKGGQKPYLWLRRKVELNTLYRPLADGGATYDGDSTGIGMSDLGGDAENQDQPYAIYQAGQTFNQVFIAVTHPTGGIESVDDPSHTSEPHFKDKFWELDSNFISAEVLNKLTGDEDNVFFDIGIL